MWGPPDLVVEVLSDSTRKYDRDDKLGWYRQYGVRECWLVELRDYSVTILDFSAGTLRIHEAKGPDSLISAVLPDSQLTAYDVFLKTLSQ